MRTLVLDVAVDFTENAETTGTTVTVTHPCEDSDNLEQGWTDVLDRLVVYADRTRWGFSAPAADSTSTTTCQAPRGTPTTRDETLTTTCLARRGQAGPCCCRWIAAVSSDRARSCGLGLGSLGYEPCVNNLFQPRKVALAAILSAVALMGCDSADQPDDPSNSVLQQPSISEVPEGNIVPPVQTGEVPDNDTDSGG